MNNGFNSRHPGISTQRTSRLDVLLFTSCKVFCRVRVPDKYIFRVSGVPDKLRCVFFGETELTAVDRICEKLLPSGTFRVVEN